MLAPYSLCSAISAAQALHPLAAPALFRPANGGVRPLYIPTPDDSGLFADASRRGAMLRIVSGCARLLLGRIRTATLRLSREEVPGAPAAVGTAVILRAEVVGGGSTPCGWCELLLPARTTGERPSLRLRFVGALGRGGRSRLLIVVPSGETRYRHRIYVPLSACSIQLEAGIRSGALMQGGGLRLKPLGVVVNLTSVLSVLLRKSRTALRMLRTRFRISPAVDGAVPVGGAAYTQWLSMVEPQPRDFPEILAHALSLSAQPLISIVMPVYNPDPTQLQAALDSVCAQIYPRWELCICDDASTDPRVRDLLSVAAEREPRIRLLRKPRNAGIAAASNAALQLSAGAFVAFLDHDDVLPPWALYFVAVEIAQRPATDLLYSDEDKLAADGSRCEPHFKGAWDPELIHAVNYLSHLLVIRRSVLERVGGFSSGMDGSQDYDLILRCAALIDPARIAHVPMILYHWRKSAGSTAASLGAKPKAHASGIRALEAALVRTGGEALVVDGPFETSYRLIHPVPCPAPRVSILIPTRDGVAHLRRCIDSIRSLSRYSNYELLVVDNGSRGLETLDYLSMLEREGRARVLRDPRPFNFSALNNFAAEAASGEILLLLNDDVEVRSQDWLEEMVGCLMQAGVGAVGAKLYYPDGRIQHGGVMLGVGGVAGHRHKHFPGGHPGYFGRLLLPQTVAAVTAACLMVRRDVYHAAGGLDEVNLPIAFNDVDFCLRLQERSLRCVWTPYAELVHHESLTRGAENTPEKLERFVQEAEYMKQRWGSGLLCDPYYSRYLSRDHENFSLNPEPEALRPWLA